jgi:hypothetical protein
MSPPSCLVLRTPDPPQVGQPIFFSPWHTGQSTNPPDMLRSSLDASNRLLRSALTVCLQTRILYSIVGPSSANRYARPALRNSSDRQISTAGGLLSF